MMLFPVYSQLKELQEEERRLRAAGRQLLLEVALAQARGLWPATKEHPALNIVRMELGKIRAERETAEKYAAVGVLGGSA
jgi:hypothetical protein